MNTLTKEQRATVYEALKRLALYHNKKVKEIKAIPLGLTSPEDTQELIAHLEGFNSALDLIGQIDDGLL